MSSRERPCAPARSPAGSDVRILSLRAARRDCWSTSTPIRHLFVVVALVVGPNATSYMFNLPRSTAPASRSRCTTTASSHGTRSLNNALAARSHASGVDQVLQSNGNTVKRPSPCPTLQFSLSLPRLRQCRFCGDRDERVENRIERVNATQAGLDQVDWRDFLLSHQSRGFVKIEVGNVIRRGDCRRTRLR